MYVRVLVLERGPFDADEVFEHLRTEGPVAIRGTLPEARKAYWDVAYQAARAHAHQADPPTVRHVSVNDADLYMGYLTHTDTCPECPTAIVREAIQQWLLYGRGEKYVATVRIAGEHRLH